ncbi:MAG: redoxin domain-containing protein [Thermodesulfobacteriota bacterium]
MSSVRKNQPWTGRIGIILAFFLILMGIAYLADQRGIEGEFCYLDGTEVLPMGRVVFTDEGGSQFLFCSSCCAADWLNSHPDHLTGLQEGKGSVTVVDEVSGREIDATLGYWVESDQFSRRENRCRVHVFGDKQQASAYLRRHKGKEVAGFIAGLGRRLSWAEDFSLGDLEDRSRKLSEFRGRIVFLRFWSLQNPFVETDLKNLQEAHDRFADQGLSVVAVNVEDNREDVAALAKRLNLTLPVLLDSSGRVADTYQVTGFPTGFLIDQSGIVDSSSIGEISADLLEPFLYSLK